MKTPPELDLQHLDVQPLGEHFVPPSAAYITDLEAQLQARLPPSYRTFLAHYGVCACNAATTFFLSDGRRMELQVFLGNDPDDSYDVLETWRGLQDRLPAQVLPFALDPFGNALCLDLRAAHAAQVYLWEHDSESLLFVASNFAQFIALLQNESA